MRTEALQRGSRREGSKLLAKRAAAYSSCVWAEDGYSGAVELSFSFSWSSQASCPVVSRWPPSPYALMLAMSLMITVGVAVFSTIGGGRAVFLAIDVEAVEAVVSV